MKNEAKRTYNIDDAGNGVTTNTTSSNYTGMFGGEHTFTTQTVIKEGPSGYSEETTNTHRTVGWFGTTIVTEQNAHGTDANGTQWSRSTYKEEAEE